MVGHYAYPSRLERVEKANQCHSLNRIWNNIYFQKCQENDNTNVTPRVASLKHYDLLTPRGEFRTRWRIQIKKQGSISIWNVWNKRKDRLLKEYCSIKEAVIFQMHLLKFPGKSFKHIGLCGTALSWHHHVTGNPEITGKEEWSEVSRAQFTERAGDVNHSRCTRNGVVMQWRSKRKRTRSRANVL